MDQIEEDKNTEPENDNRSLSNCESKEQAKPKVEIVDNQLNLLLTLNKPKPKKQVK